MARVGRSSIGSIFERDLDLEIIDDLDAAELKSFQRERERGLDGNGAVDRATSVWDRTGAHVIDIEVDVRNSPRETARTPEAKCRVRHALDATVNDARLAHGRPALACASGVRGKGEKIRGTVGGMRSAKAGPWPASRRLTERVALRIMTWLRKRGHAKDDDHASNDTPERTFAEVLANVATQRGSVENVKDDSGESEGPAAPAAPIVDEAVTRHGFNVHASLTIAAADDLGRERLCRYGLRPPFSLARFRLLPDGRVSYRVKRSSRRTSRCRIMTPVECIARICALVPPPRYPLTRFHGVLAPRALAACPGLEHVRDLSGLEPRRRAEDDLSARGFMMDTIQEARRAWSVPRDRATPGSAMRERDPRRTTRAREAARVDNGRASWLHRRSQTQQGGM